MITLVDGLRVDSLPVTDSTVIRGDAVFEAVRSYGGRPFALDEHLSRLERSAWAMGIPLPDDDRIGGWARSLAAEGGDGIVRIIVSRGDAVPGASGERRIVAMHHPLPFTPSTLRLDPVAAPWHPAGRTWELSGVKTVSYAPNVAAARVARAAGFDDAVLVADDTTVLEGTTFCVGWVADGGIRTPSVDLGILDSITRRHVIAVAAEADLDVEEGRFDLEDLARAEEVFAVSTVKEVTPVVSVGSVQFRPGPVTDRLRVGFRRRVADAIRV